ncbi:hypothetical protein [Sporichthya polymorpha]|uniref:hypothetical protein n=1 Tax=Sporichthya polymorpha TaxID=35751 RepID=UPI000377434A|nr:hypothetical protein [Sporichthya polymorpha]
MQSPRWPFLAALVAVIAGGGIAHAAPDVHPFAVDAVMTIPDREALHAAKRAFDREQPAVDQLARLAPPAGVTECNPGTLATTHFLCWRGEADIPATAGALADGLREIGATDVTPWCGELRGGSRSLLVCDVRANVLGRPFEAQLGPDPTATDPAARSSRLSVVGGVSDVVGAGLPASMRSRATPVPIPGYPS